MPGKRTVLIFVIVLIMGFGLQMAMNSAFELGDGDMWAREIRLFIARDPGQFDFDGAYANPGTPVLELGTLLHTLFGVSFNNAVTLSVSALVALAVAACSVVCFALQPESPWWLAAAGTLLLNRFCISTTPPSAVAMPLIVLIVLGAWWIMNQQTAPARKYFLGWGAVVGFACATRIEVSLLVAAPFSLLLVQRHGRRMLVPMVAAALAVFFLADPYLWTMPMQHLSDLVRRFTINYARYQNMSVYADDLVHTLLLAAPSCVWCLILLAQKRLPRILPGKIITVLTGISMLMFIVVFSSNHKPVRYFFPVMAVWEVILPLLALEAVAVRAASESGPPGYREGSTRTIAYYLLPALFVLVQLSYAISLYIYLH